MQAYQIPRNYEQDGKNLIKDLWDMVFKELLQAICNSMDRKTFWRHEQELILIGLSKVQLQNLHGQQTNVIPLIRIIDIDFSRQRPDWYQEPKSFYEQNLNFKVA